MIGGLAVARRRDLCHSTRDHAAGARDERHDQQVGSYSLKELHDADARLLFLIFFEKLCAILIAMTKQQRLVLRRQAALHRTMVDSESCAGVRLSLEETIGVPARSKLIRPQSNAASQSEERSRPLYTSRRRASLSHSAHGTMCEARRSAGSVMPVRGQVPFQ
jgi:hypothetical protein